MNNHSINSLEMLMDSPFCVIEKSDGIHLDLERIIKYGMIQGVGRYTPISQLAALLPAPDHIEDYGFGSYELVYGDMGVYIQGGKVEQIELFVDTEDGYIDGGDNCDVEYWEFEDTDDINMLNVLDVLSYENIDYKTVFDIEDSEYAQIQIPQSGVSLGFLFCGNDYGGAIDYKLCSITI